jgi:NAD(P)-dependent dehydrogenase (short-subunit alcohol dehydrogenase family)
MNRAGWCLAVPSGQASRALTASMTTCRHGDRACQVPLDVTDPAAAEAAVRTAVEALGRLDVVVNNAGYANLVAIEDITADFRAQIDTNLLGVVKVTKAALPVLRPARLIGLRLPRLLRRPPPGQGSRSWRYRAHLRGMIGRQGWAAGRLPPGPTSSVAGGRQC